MGPVTIRLGNERVLLNLAANSRDGDARWRPARDSNRTTRDGRAGFGLRSVALIVRRFGGSVDVESDRTGTSIHLHFPALSASKR